MNQASLSRKRAPMRAMITKTIKEIELALDTRDQTTFETKIHWLKMKGEELAKMDEEMMNILAESNDSEEVLISEAEGAQHYQEEIYRCTLLNTSCEITSAGVTVSNRPEVGRIKLPKLDLRVFNGELEEWLGWGAHFEKIDKASLDDAEKFQYLVQALAGPAKELVLGFPPTSENYPKALNSLKERYGNQDLLGELYTRDLLQLCIRQSKSRQDILQIHDKVETALRSLESLQINMKDCAPIITPLVESTLPEETLKAFRRALPVEKQSSKDRLTFLLQFLKKEIDTEQRVKLASRCFDPFPTRTRTAQVLHTKERTFENICIFCEIPGHKGKNCRKALRMKIDDKKAILLKKGACFICTEKGHTLKDCKMNENCPVCQKRHVLPMCPVNRFYSTGRGVPQEENKSEVQPNPEKFENKETSSNSVVMSVATILPTILVPIRGRWGQVRKVQALVDSGSQRSYIISRVATKLQLPIIGTEKVAFALFSGVTSKEQELNCYRITAQSRDTILEMEVLGTDRITNYTTQVNVKIEGKETEIRASSGPIEMLIGADYFGSLLTGNRRVLDKNLTAFETLFGWTVLGTPSALRTFSTCVAINHIEEIHDLETKFWELELLGIKDDAIQCDKKEEIMRNFYENFKYENKRYTVSLPWKNEVRPPPNRALAERRLRSVSSRMTPELYTEYDAVLKDWILTGILEEAEDNDKGHYLPHRVVVREQSNTTRVRPVFDASAKSGFLPSLNDTLSECINFIELLPIILLRFRENLIGCCADIEKAFLRINVEEKDRDFLKILWWNEEGEIISLRHTRVVFGLKPSPFLLCAVIKTHLNKLKDSNFKFPWVIEKMSNSFYMDDLVCSVNSKEELDEFLIQAKNVMESASMILRKWKFSGCDTHDVTVLGILWSTDTDELGLNIDWWEEEKLQKRDTKRRILSLIHKLFDPIGIVSPVSIVPRIFMQKIWKNKIDWDTPINEEDRKEVADWCKDIHLLKKVKIPRLLGNVETIKGVHVFCDASKAAYACVILVVIEDDDRKIDVRFVTSKARVAPKNVTIPRLELMAVLIGVRLLKSVLDSMSWKDKPVFLWSDSTTVIQWIKRNEAWSIFVKNRVTEIRRNLAPHVTIRHVPGANNPADLPSRGCSTKKIYSDRGTNFVGAANLLELINWEKVNKFATSERIDWKFNVPSAPWWGGWWERLVGLLKNIMRRVLGQASLHYQELYTILCECESIMNNRPLTYLDEGGEVAPLTPAMFLRDLIEDGMPEVRSERDDLTRRALYLAMLRRDLRKRFRNEYLGFLRAPRHKSDSRSLMIGDIVLIGDDNTRPLDFPLAVVEEMVPGIDGVERMVRLRTEKGKICRPIQRLYPLEIRSSIGKLKENAEVETTVPPIDMVDLKDDSQEDYASENTDVIDRRGRVIRRPSRYL
ncbi:uncharacterized protein LOC116176791 [Photinus pyralis]|uniref:uncharacterized protein LOC116176791 n=1 Tax=Photinus pyralis TaxID=7054 RepID=UPI001267819B|nr:uncharacterized protein LOC116176791 [Photinus pyralis]